MERDRTGTGLGMGMIMALLIGLAILALVAWYAFAQSGWFGPAAPAGSASRPQTNVNVTTNSPPASGQTSGQTGSQPGR